MNWKIKTALKIIACALLTAVQISAFWVIAKHSTFQVDKPPAPLVVWAWGVSFFGTIIIIGFVVIWILMKGENRDILGRQYYPGTNTLVHGDTL